MSFLRKLYILLSIFISLPIHSAPAITPITSKVVNVEAQFRTINDHGTPSGFYRGQWDPTYIYHYQGITPHPYRTDIYFTSKSGSSKSNPAAVMGIWLPNERASTHMRHNLWQKSVATTETSPSGDNYTYWEASDDNFCNHFGGLQASGKLLAVAAENCYMSNGRIYFYDVSSVTPTKRAVYHNGLIKTYLDVGHEKAGAVAIIEDSNNLYTIAVFADGNKVVRFMQLEYENGMLYPVTGWYDYRTPSSQDYGWETGTGAHQSINFVRQSDDSLYLIGLQRGIWQSDHMFLYRVDNIYYDTYGILRTWPSLQLTYKAKKHMYCTNWKNNGSRMCDFKAGAGVRIVNGKYGKDNGELTILAVAHDDDKGSGKNVAPITEFRNRVVNVIDPGFGYCGHSSWVTLYDDDHMNGDRNITITEDNNFKESFDYLHAGSIEFGDKTSAISYCIRPGCKFIAYKDSFYKNKLFEISGYGSGTYGYDNDLERSSGGYYRTNYSGIGDEISSAMLQCQ